jgi:hypothetical protein
MGTIFETAFSLVVRGLGGIERKKNIQSANF